MAGRRASIPTDFDRCLEVYTRSFDARRPFEMEYRLRRNDGEYQWILDKGTPRFSAEGVFLGFIGSCINIAERKLAEEAAHALSGRLIQAQERARAELARELHDDLNQGLALLSVELEMFGRNLPAEPGKIAAQLEKFSSQTRKLSSEVHQLSHELHPAKLDRLGLVAALRGFCDEFTLVHEIAIHFVEHDVPWFTPDDTALCLYRITQEALHNVVKHSGGTEATVEITFEEGQLRLIIADDGTGFDPRAARAAASLGLVSIGERVRYAGGRLAIDSRPGAGTRVEVLVPLDERSQFHFTEVP